MPFTPPLVVHLCWFENQGLDPRVTVIARELYEFLHRPVDDDVVLRPGLEIPVELGRALGDLLAQLDDRDKPEPTAAVRVVVAILDRAAFRNPSHQEVVERAVKRWPDASNGEVFVPIVLDDRWYALLPTGAQDMLAAITVK